MLSNRSIKLTNKQEMIVKRFLVLATLIMTLAVSPAVAAKRVALVIGNSAYQHTTKLSNPQNDAHLMARTLRGLGFDVLARTNLTQTGMKIAITEFGERLEQAGKDAIGLFYYAGHGIQANGNNYLIPVDAKIGNKSHLDIYGVNANWVLAQMEEAKNPLNLMVLDACRNNPFGKSWTRGIKQGLARMDAPRGTMIAYATRPGTVAADGTGANSPYTKALSKTMAKPGLTLSDVFIETRNMVMASTGGKQVPWEEGGLTSRFYFKPWDISLVTPAAVSPPQQLAVDEMDETRVAERNANVRSNPSSSSTKLSMLSAGTSVQVTGRVQGHNWFKVSLPDGRTGYVFAPLLRNPPDTRIASMGPTGASYDEGRVAFKRGDYVTALRELRPLAEQGHAVAQIGLATMYESGNGVPKDSAKAFHWYRKSAEQGKLWAQYKLGYMYRLGDGVREDPAEAFRWFRKSSEQGFVDAQWALGTLYEKGLGIPKDYMQAYKWYDIAILRATNDSMTKTATEYRDEVAKRMTLAQIAEAQKLAQEWKPRRHSEISTPVMQKVKSASKKSMPAGKRRSLEAYDAFARCQKVHLDKWWNIKASPGETADAILGACTAEKAHWVDMSGFSREVAEGNEMMMMVRKKVQELVDKREQVDRRLLITVIVEWRQ
jgi:uncharacterized protein YgiM (DUF1202 family)